jgi:hypothetical protein
MGHQQLIADLARCGLLGRLQVGDGNAEFVCFEYTVPIGAHAGEVVQVGLQAPDWPVNPPGGPHISPRINHPGDNAHHASPLGGGWIYWSRPFPEWAASQRTLEEYLAHLRTLFSQFVEAAA